jgi:hypothetical protein
VSERERERESERATERVRASERARARERERERERERAMIINKANKHLTPQIIEHIPVKEISLFWE